MNPDPVATVLEASPQPCPACGHTLRSAPDSRCSECGIKLGARLAVKSPSEYAAIALLATLTASASEGITRWLAYIWQLDTLGDGRLSRVPWYGVLIELGLLGAPFALIAVIVWFRRLQRAPYRIVVTAAVVAAVPFVANEVTVLL